MFSDDQASSRVELEDGTIITKCGQCREIYSERIPPEEPPCDTCRVEPMEENLDAFKIFGIARAQFIMGANGPIEINHLAIDAAIKREGIEDKDCFNKVLALSRWWIGKLREKKD